MADPDFKRAYQLAQLSQIVYQTDRAVILEHLNGLRLELVRLFAAPGFQALIAKNAAGEQFIIYRGTPVTCGRDLMDAIVALGYDISMKHVVIGPGRVLSGVCHAVQAHWVEMWSLIDPSKPVFLTGHSLGATMSLIAAANVSRGINLTVMVFAPFQCANAAFWKAIFEGRWECLTVFGAEFDFAPGWDHTDHVTVLAGPLIHLLETGWTVAIEWPLYRESIADHAIENYVSKVAAYVT